MYNILLFYRVEEENSSKSILNKQVREIEGQLQELTEDYETERAARSKAEKQKRDLGEELEALKMELEGSCVSMQTIQDLRTKRESELCSVKKQLEDEVKGREIQLSELRHKNNQHAEEFNEQLDSLKRVCNTWFHFYSEIYCI